MELQHATANFQQELAAIRGNLPERLGPLLDGFRKYLLAIARAELPQGLAGKVAASDVVQETLVKGCEHFHAFEGASPEQLAAWLRKILLNHLRNEAQAFAAQKRDVAREQPVDSQIAERSRSPSRELIARERMEHFQTALGRLPDELRQVIELRHREDLPFAEIGRRLAHSEDTARRLWMQAIRHLQDELAPHDSSGTF